jgi:hypothetical protein
MYGRLSQIKNPDYVKFSFSVLLACYAGACMRSVEEGSFLTRVNLIPHEAGHLLFGYFGLFMLVIGGTLGQLLVPGALACYFAARREFFSSSVVLFWFGQNFLDISVYVKDAAAMELPLVSIGGGDSIHDWNWLLLKFNLLAYDQTIGNGVRGLGSLAMTAAVILCFYFSLPPTSPSPTSESKRATFKPKI